MKARILHVLAALLFLVATLQPSSGCLNDYRPNVVAIERSKSLIKQLTEHPVAEVWTVRRDRLRKALAEGGNFQVKNDLATSLLHTGEAQEAVKLLTEIEVEKPGLYFTAANLGTAYELTGDNRQALEWIQRGIERNPDGHEGTEWLHVKILEAKLAIAEDEKWLETHSVLGDFPKREDSKITGNRGEFLSTEQIKKALTYQLHERLQFVPPPEPVVGVLLLDLGYLIGEEPAGIGGAKSIFELAGTYLASLPAEHRLRENQYAAVLNATIFGEKIYQRESDTINLIGFLGTLISGGVLALGVIAWLRRNRRRQAEAEAKAKTSEPLKMELV